MVKNLKLIATLPNLNYKEKIIRVLECPQVAEVRYNTGTNDLMTTKEMLTILCMLQETYKKKIWIDLKGRQLRITKWADPLYEVIELNHEIEVLYPAKIIFRNGCTSSIVKTRGNKIIVDPIPKEAVGSGQAVNILARDLDIKGYLTPKDIEVLSLCKELGLNNIMASFVEEVDDIKAITDILPEANIISKIESIKGLKFVRENPGYALMAARDDLFVELDEEYEIIEGLKDIIKADENAICASKIFSSLRKRVTPDLADYSDLEYMQILGFKKFMLDDTISHHHFEEAVKAWVKVLK